MKYAQQANAPEWHDSDPSKLYASATSGSSPFNEWFEFDDRADARAMIAQTFTSQAYYDRFTWFEGEVYDYDAFTPESKEFAESSDDFLLKDGAKPADLADMIRAESRF
jgi:hypothetical protein